jgi:hypothetical protein
MMDNVFTEQIANIYMQCCHSSQRVRIKEGFAKKGPSPTLSSDTLKSKKNYQKGPKKVQNRTKRTKYVTSAKNRLKRGI